MWWRVVGLALLPLLVLSLFLSFNGVVGVPSGDTYLLFFKNVQSDVSRWAIQIPKIPELPSSKDLAKILKDTYGDGDLFTIIVSMIQNFIDKINAFIRFLNVIIAVLNAFIQLLQFVLTFIYDIGKLIDKFPRGSERTPFYNPYA